jgi:hypothetical protein
MTDIPDDLSGMDEPPRFLTIGDIDPATLAAYDQILEYLRFVSHRLFITTFQAVALDPNDPAQRERIAAFGQEAADLVWSLDEPSKALLINMLVGQLCSAAEQAVDAGWLPLDAALDDPMKQDHMASVMGMSLDELRTMVEKVKARRAANEGDAQLPPSTDPSPQ